jgi:hypothetical protein
MRYNFHDELAKIRANPKHVLPLDINSPIKGFLQKIGCELAIDELTKLQNCVGYATIEICNSDLPSHKISIQVDSGMASEYKDFKVKNDGKWSVAVCKTVKNSNLDKRRVKDEKNEHAAAR